MTVSKIASKIYQEAKAKAKGAWDWKSEWSKAMKQAWREVTVKYLEESKALLLIKVEGLVARKKAEFGSMDIESAMSDREKKITDEISGIWSKINCLVKKIRSC